MGAEALAGVPVRAVAEFHAGERTSIATVLPARLVPRPVTRCVRHVLDLLAFHRQRGQEVERSGTRQEMKFLHVFTLIGVAIGCISLIGCMTAKSAPQQAAGAAMAAAFAVIPYCFARACEIMVDGSERRLQKLNESMEAQTRLLVDIASSVARAPNEGPADQEESSVKDGLGCSPRPTREGMQSLWLQVSTGSMPQAPSPDRRPE
jgi:hypothetical protein